MILPSHASQASILPVAIFFPRPPARAVHPGKIWGFHVIFDQSSEEGARHVTSDCCFSRGEDVFDVLLGAFFYDFPVILCGIFYLCVRKDPAGVRDARDQQISW